MRILFAGTPEVAAQSLRQLVTDPRFAMFEVVGVLTREDAPFGRKRALTASPVAALAAELGLPVIKANRVDEEVNQQIAALEADCAVVIAFGVILRQATLDLMPKGWFNLHFSLLPRHRGAAPVAHALLEGDAVSGVTLFRLTRGMDEGPILATQATEIEPGENAGELLARLRNLSDGLLAEQLPLVAADLHKLTPQSASGVSAAGKLNRQMARLDPRASANALERLVRAMNPEPVAWANLGGQPLRVLRALAVAGASELPVGQIAREGERILLQCGVGLLWLQEVQPAGGRPMKAADWYRGLPAAPRLDAVNED